MRILLFAASFPLPEVGGSVEYICNIVKNLPKQSVTIHTGNAYPKESVQFDKNFPQTILRNNFIHHPMEGHRRSKFRRALMYFAWPFVSFWLIAKHRPDIVQIGEGNTAGIGALVAKKILGIPYVHFVYAEEITIYKNNWLRNALFWKAVRGAVAIITVSEYSRGLLLDGNVNPDRVHKIVPAIGNAKMEPIAPQIVNRWRDYFGLNGKRVVLTVGAVKERKGQATVIEAMPSILEKHPETIYVIAGSGELETVLRKRVVQLGLSAQVKFTGRVDNEILNSLYEICDVFIMPHRQVQKTMDTEGCPTVFLEASSHGKPVIGGNAGGVTDAIRHAVTGFIIDGTDIFKVAEHTNILLSDRGLAERMGQAGRCYVKNFRPEISAAETLRICQLAIESF